MKLVIAGASGFIGSALVQRLSQQSDSLILLSRKPRSPARASNTEWLVWDPGVAGWLGRVHRWRRRRGEFGWGRHCRQALDGATKGIDSTRAA